MASRGQYKCGECRTAAQLKIKGLPSNTLFQCEVQNVLRWDNEAAEMRLAVEAVWRTRNAIDGKRYVLPTVSSGGLYIEMRTLAA